MEAHRQRESRQRITSNPGQRQTAWQKTSLNQLNNFERDLKQALPLSESPPESDALVRQKYGEIFGASQKEFFGQAAGHNNNRDL